MNCIFVCTFGRPEYLEMLFLLLESVYKYGNIDCNTTEILIYTTSAFQKQIQESNLMSQLIRFEINDTYVSIEHACYARLDLFSLPSIHKYQTILYLDTDIIITQPLHTLFDEAICDVLYAGQEGTIDNAPPGDFWGCSLFGDEVHLYQDKSAFSSGILLFRNCDTIRTLFQNIIEDKNCRISYQNNVYDQPYIIYNAFKYNLYDNKTITKYITTNADDMSNDLMIHHFAGGPGNTSKLPRMQKYLHAKLARQSINHVH